MNSDNKYCSPKNSNNSYTCFTNKSLKKIANAYNNENSDKIKIPAIINKKERNNLWKKIKMKMNNKFNENCKSDYCLLNNRLINNLDVHEDFRPEMPKEWINDDRTWLSTVDIKEVMDQYMVKFSKKNKEGGFLFIGPVPIDFDHKISFGNCISDELCNINISNLLKKNINKIGVVFNLDPHYKSGSHWTALYADLKIGAVYYFDSYGIKPPDEVSVLMERIRKQMNNLIKNKKISISDKYNEYSKFSKKNLNSVLINSDNFKEDYVTYFGKKNKNNITIFKDSVNNIKELKVSPLKKGGGNKNIECILKNKINLPPGSNVIVMKSFRTMYNDNRFQFKNSECGVYSMHFIEEFLNGKEFEEIIENIIHDDEINKKRNIYYRPNLE